MESLPAKYLGSALKAKGLKLNDWLPIVHKVNNRFASWKCTLLTMAGPLVLVKLVTFGILIYYTSIFRMPTGIQRQLETIIQRFLWKGIMNERVLAKVA